MRLLPTILLVLVSARAQAQGTAWLPAGSEPAAAPTEAVPRPLASLTDEELELESDVAEVEAGAGVTLIVTGVALGVLAVVAGVASEIRELRCSSLGWSTTCSTYSSVVVGHDEGLLALSIAAAGTALAAILVGGPGLALSATRRGRRIRRERELRSTERPWTELRWTPLLAPTIAGLHVGAAFAMSF